MSRPDPWGWLSDAREDVRARGSCLRVTSRADLTDQQVDHAARTVRQALAPAVPAQLRPDGALLR